MGYIGNGPYQGVLTGGNIQDGTVETTDLADGAVTTVKIADASVTATKLAAGAAVPSQSGQSGKYLTTDGSTASWGTVDLSSKVSKTGDTMTGALSVAVSDGDLKFIRTFHGSAATYNSASVGTPNKIVSGVDVGWYSDYWRMGATRGGGADIQELMFVRSSNLTDTKMLGIDSSGRVTMPYQPASCAYNASTNVGNITYSAEQFDNAGSMNVSTGRFTAPVAGVYCVMFSSFYNSSRTDNGDIMVRVNGSNRHRLSYTNESQSAFTALGGASLVKVNANDYISIYTEGTVHGNDATVFSVFLVG